jgi:hypothetical protein
MVGIGKPSLDFQSVGGMVLRNEDEKWLSTTGLCDKSDAEIEREVTIIATVHGALAWKDIREHPTEDRISPRTVICPPEADGLSQVLYARDI